MKKRWMADFEKRCVPIAISGKNVLFVHSTGYTDYSLGIKDRVPIAISAQKSYWYTVPGTQSTHWVKETGYQ